MKKKLISIVAGGDVSDDHLQDIQKSDVVIGADRGAWWLIEHTVIPDYAIGDFDSVSKEQLEIIQEISPNVVQYRVEKDEIDLELAIRLAQMLQPDELIVYGATGSRLDQTLAGIYLLETVKGIDIRIVNTTNSICLITNQKEINQSDLFPYCSFLSLTNTSRITLKGFKFPLTNNVLLRKKSLGISNEINSKKAIITVHSGKILCIQSKG